MSKSTTTIVNASALFRQATHATETLKASSKARVLNQKEFRDATGLKGQHMKREYRKYLTDTNREVRQSMSSYDVKSIRHANNGKTIVVTYTPRFKATKPRRRKATK
jgi:hypothetical protein